MPHNPLAAKFGEGSCASCGFLTQTVLRDHDRLAGAQYGPGGALLQIMRSDSEVDGFIYEVEHREATLWMRRWGNFSASAADIENPTRVFAVPACFVFACEPTLSEEVGFVPGQEDSPDPKAVVSAIQRSDRACKKWFEWRPGITPADHVRMRDMIEMEGDRRKWEQVVEDDRKKWEDLLERDRRRFERGLSRAQITAAAGTAVVSIFVAVILTYVTIRYTEPKETSGPQPVIVVTPAPTALGP